MRYLVFLFFIFISQLALAQEINTRNTVYIPVVIHILYNQQEQNISVEQITKQIESLNKDFSLNNENFDSTPAVFQSVAADIGIQFCLASKDPQGLESTGITRTETFVQEIGLTELYFLSDEGGKDAWDQEKYINIWVGDMGNSGILGITPLPGDGSPAAKDGILINYKYFGVNGDHQDLNRNLGKVLTHEMGHYFGLEHIWGTLNTNCDDDDGINDTPLQDGPNFGCPDFPSPDICTQGNGVMFTNYMDYTDDDCLTMFTEGQRDKIYETMELFRAELGVDSELNCVLYIEDKELHNFNVYPNPATNLLHVSFEKELYNREIQLYNTSGVLVKNWAGAQKKETFHVGNLAAGVYFIKSGNNVKKVVIY
jgi:hypothetical protein